jgi:pimeloyl-ACP methyl ester carboxylesterase
MTRATIDVGGIPISYLTAGEGPLVLLLHGTYWSRVWQPVLRPVPQDRSPSHRGSRLNGSSDDHFVTNGLP